MTTTPAAPAPQAGQARTLHLSELLRRPITDNGGESIGRLSDVIVRLRGPELPLVIGGVASVGGREVFVPLEQVSEFDGEALRLTSAQLDLRQFERREGEVLLRADVLGHRLIDVEAARLIKAADLELEERNGEWVLTGVDTRRRRGGLGALFGRGEAESDRHQFREWSRFEPLIGHTGSLRTRGPFGRIRRLKPAQIADLLEDASKEEETEILGQVHEDPELEADVFEELDEDLAIRLLGARTDAEIAEVLSRMRADDAADAIAELPQARRQPVLDLLPAGAAHQGADADGLQPDQRGRPDGRRLPRGGLRRPGPRRAGRGGRRGQRCSQRRSPACTASTSAAGCAGWPRWSPWCSPTRPPPVSEIYDDDPVRVGADTDVVDVAVLMSDYNLITIPVVDERRKMIGVITVDDVLEATLPDDWRRREAAQPPDAHRGDPT